VVTTCLAWAVVEEVDRVGPTQISFHQFIEEIGGHVRGAVEKMLALTESREEVEVIGGLDERIARGDQP
jgi:hypothetical protein